MISYYVHSIRIHFNDMNTFELICIFLISAYLVTEKDELHNESVKLLVLLSTALSYFYTLFRTSRLSPLIIKGPILYYRV